MLRSKSLTQLRGIAQSFGIPGIFEMDQAHLIQAIEAKQQSLTPPSPVEIPRPMYDARLMDRPPAKKGTKQEMEELLKPYIERGLHLTFSDEQWFMRCGKKTDQGTIRMPLKHLLRCAERMM